MQGYKEYKCFNMEHDVFLDTWLLIESPYIFSFQKFEGKSLMYLLLEMLSTYRRKGRVYYTVQSLVIKVGYSRCVLDFFAAY